MVRARVVTEGHLGGYVEGGDPATWFPDLWRWTVEDLGVRSMIDVGCGAGGTVDFYRSLGVEAVGIDGATAREGFIRHDFTAGVLPFLPAVDLCWSCEFVEHVEPEHVPNFLAAFRRARLLLMTHAFPGQPGWHHVNCQEPIYWRRLLGRSGFRFDADLTKRARAQAALNTFTWTDDEGEHRNHFLRSGLAFWREP